MKKITEDWIKSAESDLLLIEEIITNQILTHIAAFHAQQAIEKGFKAIIEEYDLDIPVKWDYYLMENHKQKT